jgi:hypothetical protein
MGYYIQIKQSAFMIHKNNLSRFFELVGEMMSDNAVAANGNGGSWGGDGRKTNFWYSWVNTDAVRKAVADRDIIQVFEEWGYELDFINEGTDGVNHYRLDIRGGEAKIGDEEKFFAVIAPVVEDGSLLDVRGEDDAEWRWMWENGKFFSQDILRKEIIFAEPNEITFNKEGN